MAIQTEITRKDINFIDDVPLRDVLRKRLNELDKVSLINCNFSTIFLAISTLEGILKHIASIFKTQIGQIPSYPLITQGRHKGKRKGFDKLQINDLYHLLKETRILPDIKGFEEIFSLFRDYRNFIHPQAHKRKDWAIDLGQAQMALGLLNATIGHLAEYIFIEKQIFRRFEGNPDYSDGVLQLKLHTPPLHSLLVWDRKVSNTLSLNFDLELPIDSVFNLVFNFVDEGNFKMLRLDNRRSNPMETNCLLHCTQRFFWKKMLFAEPADPPPKSVLPVRIEIDFPKKIFSFFVNGKKYIFKDEQDHIQNLFHEIRPDLKIGFFNEKGPVKLGNIRL